MTLQELFTDETKWCKGAVARDANGYPVLSDSPSAVCWCLYGGIEICYPDDFYAAESKFTDALPEGFLEVSQFNDDDETTFADVRAAIERAGI
jgi:hypothetical protein